jgi:hypothetical protein
MTATSSRRRLSLIAMTFAVAMTFIDQTIVSVPHLAFRPISG